MPEAGANGATWRPLEKNWRAGPAVRTHKCLGIPPWSCRLTQELLHRGRWKNSENQSRARHRAVAEKYAELASNILAGGTNIFKEEIAAETTFD